MGSAVDKHRKQQKKKELKKNKAKREEQREFSLVKKDVRGIQSEIKELEQNASRSQEDNERLASLKGQLNRSIKAKEKYAEEHPEARNLLFPISSSSTAQADTNDNDDGKGLYTRDGKLRHPERSAYYHPVFNPFGVPPPGMPYKERSPANTDNDEDDTDDESESDEDIPMPEGPPPDDASETDGDSDDDDDDSLADIPMPEGPPPPKEIQRGERLKTFPQPFHYDPARRTIPSSTAPPRPFISAPPSMAATHAAPPVPISQPRPQQQQPSVTAPATSVSSSSTISAAPVLRDLKKEATAFVPHALKKRKK